MNSDTYISICTKTNIYSSTFQFVLVLYNLETSKLSYIQFNYKWGVDSSILSKFVNYTNSILNPFDLKFYKNVDLLVYFQTFLVSLNFDKSNLSYLSLIYCYPILAQFQAHKSENLLKIHFISCCPKNLHTYTYMNPLSNKLSPT